MLSRFYSDVKFVDLYCLESKDPGSKISPGDRLTSGWCGFVTVALLVPDREMAAPVFDALFRVFGWNKILRS
jgi:hypothetical protein